MNCYELQENVGKQSYKKKYWRCQRAYVVLMLLQENCRETDGRAGAFNKILRRPNGFLTISDAHLKQISP